MKSINMERVNRTKNILLQRVLVMILAGNMGKARQYNACVWRISERINARENKTA